MPSPQSATKRSSHQWFTSRHNLCSPDPTQFVGCCACVYRPAQRSLVSALHPDIFHGLDVDAENAMKLLRLITTAAVLFSVGYLLDCRHAGGCRKKHGEEQLDDALDNTFPASDPTATQDFSIPANRM